MMARTFVRLRWMWVPILAFSLTRLGILMVIYLAEPLLADYTAPPPYHLRPDNVILDTLGSRWDTGFYLSIAEEGYTYTGVRLPSVAFFPLLPLLIRAVTFVVGDALVAGIIITNLALLIASLFFYRWVEDEWGAAVAGRAVWYLLIFPVSFFGSAIYSESLFLMSAIGALYFARRGYWESAALLGFFTALTRFLGILLAPLLFIEWWCQYRNRSPERRPSRWAALAGLGAVLGLGLYLLYLWQTFGDPLAFAKASAAWGRVGRSPFDTVRELLQRPAEGWGAALLAGHLPLDNWIDLLTVSVFVGLGGVLLWQRRWGEGAFVVVGALLPLSSGLLMSQRRYMWVLFPVYVLLARWGQRTWVHQAITTICLLGLGLFTALFANWYWVG